MFNLSDPQYFVYIPLPDGFEMFFAIIAGLSLFLVVRAVWRTLSGG
jgi:hypothetical protein